MWLIQRLYSKAFGNFVFCGLSLKANKFSIFEKMSIMDQQIAIFYPEKLAFSMRMKRKEFESEMKLISLVKLYELGKISSGVASKLLDMTRIEFLEILKKYNDSYFYNGLEEELEADLDNA